MHALDYFCTISKIQIKELAALLNVKQPQINSWKKGTRKIPKHHLKALCELFMIPMENSEIFERSNIGELDRAEIELFLNKNVLKNALEDEEEYMPEVIQTFKHRLIASKATVEMLSLVEELKNTVKTATILTRYNEKRFQEQLDRIRQLIEVFKNDTGI